jgi:hypothetical protein
MSSQQRVETADEQRRPRRKLRIWAAIFAIGLISAYVSLPWWMPTNWAADIFVARLSKQLGRTVKIGRVEVSWKEGVRVFDVKIGRPGGNLDDPAVSIEQIRCPLTPIQSAISGKVEQLLVNTVQIGAEIDGDGKVDIADLLDQPAVTSDLQIRDCTIRLRRDGQDTLAAISIGAGALFLDETAGSARFHFEQGTIAELAQSVGASANQESLLIRGSGELTAPKLNLDVPLGGRAVINWTALDLANVFPATPNDSGMPKLDGTCEGELEIQVAGDLQLSWILQAKSSGLHVEHARIGDFQAGNVKLESKGQWDPTADRLDVRHWLVEAQGIEATGEFHAASGEKATIDSFAQCKVDVERIRMLAEGLGILLPQQTAASGEAEIKINWAREGGVDTIDARIDSQDLVLSSPGILDLRAEDGNPFLLAITGQAECDGGLDVEIAEARIGPLTASASASLDFPTIGKLDVDSFASIRRTIEFVRSFECEASVSDADALASMIPAWGNQGVASCSGPFDFQASIKPTDDGASTSLRIQAPLGSVFSMSPYLEKPADATAEASLSCRLDRQPATSVKDISIVAKIDNAAIEVTERRTAVQWSAQPTIEPGRPDAADLKLRASVPLRIKNVHRWLECSPILRQWSHAVALSGSLDLDLQLDANGLWDNGFDKWSASLNGWLDARGLDVMAQPPALTPDRGEDDLFFIKPAGRRALASIRWRANGGTNANMLAIGATVELPGCEFTGAYRQSDSEGGLKSAWASLTAHDAASAVMQFPALGKRLGPMGVRGALSHRVQVTRRGRRTLIDSDTDATELSIRISEDGSLSKPAGVNASLEATLEFTDSQESNPTRAIRIASAEATLGGARLWVDEGSVRLTPSAKRGNSYEVRLPMSARVALNGEIARLSPDFAGWKQRLRMDGEIQLSIELHALDDYISTHVSADLTDFGLQTSADMTLPLIEGAFVKPLGFQARITGDATMPVSRRVQGWWCEAHNLRAVLGDMQLSAEGRIALRDDPANPWPPSASFHSAISIPDLKQAQKLVRQRDLPNLTGEINAELTGRFEKNQWRMDETQIAIQDFEIELAGRTIEIDGELESSSDDLMIPGLSVRAGSSNLDIAGRVRREQDRISGRLAADSDLIDVDDLVAFASDLSEMTDVVKRRRGEAPTDAGEFFRGFIRDCDITGDIEIADLKFSTPDIVGQIELQEFAGLLSLKDDRCEIPFHSAISGGVLEGVYVLGADVDGLFVDGEFRARRMLPDKTVLAWVATDFPGMTPEGRVTQTQDFRQPLSADNPAPPVGTAELIIEGGYIVGRSAPQWLTRVLTMLDQTVYRFEKMHNWVRMNPDGKQENHMIFAGEEMDLYMVGHTTPEGWTEYEIGWSPFANFESKFWTETEVARLPLFVSTGWVKDGQIKDQIIRYVPIHRLLHSVVAKNLTIPWHLLRRVFHNPSKEQS